MTRIDQIKQRVAAATPTHRTYFDGLREGITRYAWWKDGRQWVGTTGRSLKEALSDVAIEEQGVPPDSHAPQDLRDLLDLADALKTIEWTQHRAGIFWPNGTQYCTRCGVKITDYRNTTTLSDTPPLRGWEEGAFVYCTRPATRQDWQVSTPEQSWCECGVTAILSRLDSPVGDEGAEG